MLASELDAYLRSYLGGSALVAQPSVVLSRFDSMRIRTGWGFDG